VLTTLPCHRRGWRCRTRSSDQALLDL